MILQLLWYSFFCYIANASYYYQQPNLISSDFSRRNLKYTKPSVVRSNTIVFGLFLQFRRLWNSFPEFLRESSWYSWSIGMLGYCGSPEVFQFSLPSLWWWSFMKNLILQNFKENRWGLAVADRIHSLHDLSLYSEKSVSLLLTQTY